MQILVREYKEHLINVWTDWIETKKKQSYDVSFVEKQKKDDSRLGGVREPCLRQYVKKSNFYQTSSSKNEKIKCSRDFLLVFFQLFFIIFYCFILLPMNYHYFYMKLFSAGVLSKEYSVWFHVLEIYHRAYTTAGGVKMWNIALTPRTLLQ